MKRLTLALLALLLLAGVGDAELRYQAISATSTNKTIRLDVRYLTLINSGANTVYVRVFMKGEIPAAATTSSAKILINESFSFQAPGNSQIQAISIICDTAETATVRLYAL